MQAPRWPALTLLVLQTSLVLTWVIQETSTLVEKAGERQQYRIEVSHSLLLSEYECSASLADTSLQSDVCDSWQLSAQTVSSLRRGRRSALHLIDLSDAAARQTRYRYISPASRSEEPDASPFRAQGRSESVQHRNARSLAEHGLLAHLTPGYVRGRQGCHLGYQCLQREKNV